PMTSFDVATLVGCPTLNAEARARRQVRIGVEIRVRRPTVARPELNEVCLAVAVEVPGQPGAGRNPTALLRRPTLVAKAPVRRVNWRRPPARVVPKVCEVGSAVAVEVPGRPVASDRLLVGRHARDAELARAGGVTISSGR